MIPFAEYSARVEQHIQKAYGVRVVTRDVPDPLTGDLNGAEIHIDYAVTPEQRLVPAGPLVWPYRAMERQPGRFRTRPAAGPSGEPRIACRL